MDPCTANWDKWVKNCQNVHFFFAFLTSRSGKLHSFNPFFCDFLSINQLKLRARCRTPSAWALPGHKMMIASGAWPVTWTGLFKKLIRVRRGPYSGYRYWPTRSRIELEVSCMKSFSLKILLIFISLKCFVSCRNQTLLALVPLATVLPHGCEPAVVPTVRQD